MQFKRYFTILLVSLGLLTTFSGCKKLMDLDINKDPNNPTNAPFRLLLTSSQLNIPIVFEGVNQTTLGFVGILANQGSDAFNLNNNSFDGLWTSFYVGGMKDLDELLKATAGGQSPHFRGVAQTMKAYFFSQFVDLFGDVPYSEAFKGNVGDGIFAPKFDAAKNIYDDLIKLTDSAAVNLNATSPIALSGDLYYGNNVARWRTLANTVKLHLLMKTRHVRPTAQTEIGAIFASGNYIKAADGSEDFHFRYNRQQAPDGRHPWYRSSYLGVNNFTYFSKQFMLELLENEDPRQPYLVRRQTANILNPAIPTERGTIPVFNGYIVLDPSSYQRLFYDKGRTPTRQDSIFLAGFFGRVRGDQTGVPADPTFRAVPAAYPAGGLCDYPYSTPASSVRALTANPGAGSGVFPFITANMVQWWQLEYMLAYNQGDARPLFEQAIRQSFRYIISNGKAADPSCPDVPTSAIDAQVALWLARYDAANSNERKMDVVLKHAWFANMANGIEIYTTFRRTTYPSTIDLPASRVRQFALRLPYPTRELNLNAGASSYANVIFDNDAIFWDVKKFKF